MSSVLARRGCPAAPGATNASASSAATVRAISRCPSLCGLAFRFAGLPCALRALRYRSRRCPSPSGNASDSQSITAAATIAATPMRTSTASITSDANRATTSSPLRWKRGILSTPLLSGGRAFAVLLHPEFHDPADQADRHRLVERKPHRPLRPFVGRQLLFELLERARRGIEPDVMLVGGEVHQVAVLREGRHLVFDRFLRLRRRLADGAADRPQLRAHRRWKRGDVLIDVLWRRAAAFHLARQCNPDAKAGGASAAN